MWTPINWSVFSTTVFTEIGLSSSSIGLANSRNSVVSLFSPLTSSTIMPRNSVRGPLSSYSF